MRQINEVERAKVEQSKDLCLKWCRVVKVSYRMAMMIKYKKSLRTKTFTNEIKRREKKNGKK